MIVDHPVLTVFLEMVSYNDNVRQPFKFSLKNFTQSGVWQTFSALYQNNSVFFISSARNMLVCNWALYL